ncbi:FkbM family methyltransferase [Candidatus Altiarchaeota archaeon]
MASHNLQIRDKDGFSFHYRPGTADENQLDFPLDMFMIPEYRIWPHHVVVDVGGHIGTFAVPMAKKVPRGKVYSIEPGKESYSILEKNVLLNGLGNVSLHNLALTDYQGTARLYHAPDNETWGDSITNPEGEAEEVRADTLENFLEENNIEKVDFMKVNCEGAEFEIIQSSTKDTLSKISLLLILYHCDYNEGQTEQSMIEHLKEKGFRVWVREKEGERGWIIARNKKVFHLPTLRQVRFMMKNLIRKIVN